MGKGKIHFQKLTPIRDVDLGAYKNALDFVFENDDLKNIAIAGAYSAGKSSILETYKASQKNKNFIHISLAHFESPDRLEHQEHRLASLEGKILNQLIHQIPPDNIPQTNFRVKKNLVTQYIWRSALLISSFLLLILYTLFFDTWCLYAKKIMSLQYVGYIASISTHRTTQLICALLVLSISVYFIKELLILYKNKRIFKKVSVQGAEIEIFEESEDSYFDKYLNEVLYLFENSGADVVVFEDMDRYNATQIFERLREVNTLVNNYSLQQHQSPLRFFYLLRDDIFTSKDRTKFFDYIIPVVPVIDGSNSYDTLISLFSNTYLASLFEHKFLQNLSLYIDDMRILKNIFNEFTLYKEKLDTIELDPNKLLAIITYKNIFPRDFSELQLGKGFISTLFSQKETFIYNEIAQLNQKIREIEDRLNTLRQEHLKTIEEVDLLYEVKRKEVESTFYSGRSSKEEQIKKEYTHRKEALSFRNKGGEEKLKLEQRTLNEALLASYTKKLSEIISRENIDEIFKVSYVDEIGQENTFSEIKSSDYFPLLKYLIRNGYIDETYSDYITYFYEHSLSKEDKIFLRSVADKKAKEFTYRLRDVSKVVSRLSDSDFTQIETLNFDLVAYLLKNKRNSRHLIKIIQQLKETKNYPFIISFWGASQKRVQFVEELNTHWPKLFSLMFSEGDFTSDIIKDYSLLSIYNCSDEVIAEVNEGSVLTNYISENSHYLDIDAPKIDRIIYVFKLIKVSFICLEYKDSYTELFEKIYEHSLYEININNISLLLKQIFTCSESDIATKNFSLIHEQSTSHLYEYIIDNFSLYIDIIMEAYSEFYDDEKAFSFILNHADITIETKKQYIAASHSLITNIDGVRDSALWEVLIDKKLISPSATNIIKYFSVNEEYDEALVKFINEFNGAINFASFQRNEQLRSFFVETVKSNTLSNDKYSSILGQIKYVYNTSPPESVDKDKVDILIELKIFKMTKEMLIAIRDSYKENLSYFILSNIDEYISLISDELFDTNELLIVLSSNVSDEQKITLLNFETGSLSAFGENYSDEVIGHILSKNLDRSELQEIFDSYQIRKPQLKKIIYDIALINLPDVFVGDYALPVTLYHDIFQQHDITRETKKELFASLLPRLTLEECKYYLELLSMSDFADIFTNKRPKFPVTTINEQLLEIFKNKRWIRDFTTDKDTFRVFKSKVAVNKL